MVLFDVKSLLHYVVTSWHAVLKEVVVQERQAHLMRDGTHLINGTSPPHPTQKENVYTGS